jgi:hypothetical protein
MITIDDFTLLPEGSVALLEGGVARCPACGRNGVLKHPEHEAPYCIHAEESETLCDGMRTDPTDCCRLPQ